LHRLTATRRCWGIQKGGQRILLYPIWTYDLDLKYLDLEPLDLEPLDLEPLDLEPLDLEPLDLGGIDLEELDLNLEGRDLVLIGALQVSARLEASSK
jgi:hypothetical protein